MFDRLESAICLEKLKSLYPRTSLDKGGTLDCYNIIIMPYPEMIVIRGLLVYKRPKSVIFQKLAMLEQYNKKVLVNLK